jgi:hypothetical protein
MPFSPSPVKLTVRRYRPIEYPVSRDSWVCLNYKQLLLVLCFSWYSSKALFFVGENENTVRV